MNRIRKFGFHESTSKLWKYQELAKIKGNNLIFENMRTYQYVSNKIQKGFTIWDFRMNPSNLTRCVFTISAIFWCFPSRNPCFTTKQIIRAPTIDRISITSWAWVENDGITFLQILFLDSLFSFSSALAVELSLIMTILET